MLAAFNDDNTKNTKVYVKMAQCLDNRVNKYRGFKYKCTQAFGFAEG